MSKKIRILVNGVTLDDANLVPLILKIKYWKKKGALVDLIGSQRLFERFDNDLFDKHINIGKQGDMGGGVQFIFNSIKRNLVSLKHLSSINNYDTVYSISSVLDLIIIPFILKKVGKAKKWVSVFDNTVPLVVDGKIISGNPFIRILAWCFFQISVAVLKDADVLFVVKPELEDYLVSRGLSANKITITGNGVEKNYIEKSKVVKKHQSDALFVGRINEAKGVFDLLSVVKIVKKKYPNFKLSIMGLGDNTTMKKFQAKIHSLNLSQNIKLLGFKTGQEKYDIIKSCKLFLFLSKTESVPVAPMEAVCSGKVTLVYDLDAYKMYKNNELIKFKVGDYSSVAVRVLEIIKGGNYINKAGLLLINRFSWDSIAELEFQQIGHVTNNKRYG